MKHLIKAIETEQKGCLNEFVLAIDKLKTFKELDCWHYNNLMPKGKSISSYEMQSKIVGGLDALKSYLIKRKEKAVYKSIEREVKKVQSVFNAGELLEVKISIEWKKSQMWGSNPSAECWYSYKDAQGNYASNYVKSGSIGGCGYDKQSTAVANCLNQINEVLKPLYKMKDNNINSKNHELLGYGAGYGITPSIEGGVGVSCYDRIFNKIGYEFKTVASGKTFDVYTITKKA